MLSRKATQKIKKIRTYEQYIEGYKQWKLDKEYLHLQEMYNNSTDKAERKALARALYQMEIE
ncbi:hypothetical protein [Rossellomorea aquimaris]|uniref:Uncharacterized protein n=1 Tax=Rossellomorea aquimaris TaxID=189382 RepID=A0A1J6W0V1_9BACI|nr:hypothetical protein [Rossellomorea aquimaris]OIU71202.1 hypothetical protein BHE18_09175 [Rossellomorea aquimaris]